MRESISISLPEAVKADLDSFSERRGISRSEAVREALEQYLFVERFRALRAQLMPYGEAQGIFTDEDVFREIS
ncbi:hypothetical protein BH20GEM2_BH20GEM2_12610 [soil metagenome]|jgi:metal-responsive CopG/Arc/MetJ family transcriptional regulator